MSNLKDKLEQAVKRSPEFEKLKDNVTMTVTGEGLRVELIESEKGMFFESGRPDPSELGRELIERLAQELGKLPNEILIEGHTDAKTFVGRGGYSNWELSSDRANAARRLMEGDGLRPNQVKQACADSPIRAYAIREHPDSASNRRVSVIVRYQQAITENQPPGEKSEKKEGEEKKVPEGKKEHKGVAPA